MLSNKLPSNHRNMKTMKEHFTNSSNVLRVKIRLPMSLHKNEEEADGKNIGPEKI